MAARTQTILPDMSSSFTEKLYDQVEKLRDVEIKLRQELHEANSEIETLKREIHDLTNKPSSSKTRRTKKGQVPRGRASAPGTNRNSLSVGRHFVEPSDNEASDNEDASHLSHEEDEEEHSTHSPARTVGSKSKREDIQARHEPPVKKPRHNTPKLQQVFELLAKDAKLQQGILFSVGTKDEVMSKNAFELYFQDSTNGVIYWLKAKSAAGTLYRSAKDAVGSTDPEPMPYDELEAYKMLFVRTDKGQLEDLWSLYERWSKAEARKTAAEVPRLHVTPPTDRKPVTPRASPHASPAQSPMKKPTKHIPPNPLAKSDESDDEQEEGDQE